jgi:hypothetical protein
MRATAFWWRESLSAREFYLVDLDLTTTARIVEDGKQ